MIEKIEHEGELLALIVRDSYNNDGLNFVTGEEHSFQVGMHNVFKGTRYRAHKSRPFGAIEGLKSNKIYYVKEGKVGVDVYDKQNKKINYISLNKGDLMIFFEGAHGLDVLEDSKFIEIKQGPYRGVEADKEFIESKKQIE